MMGQAERKPLRERLLPHPVLTVALIVLWIALLNSLSFGGILVGVALGLGVSLLTANIWPERPRIRSYSKVVSYLLLVMWDIVVANIQVARLILFRPVSQLHTRWIEVPLELDSPEAITVLAGTITMTPGTVSCDLSSDGRSLLVHCLDAPDAEAAARDMKSRYEARLKEIF